MGVALITGASRGIGSLVAPGLVADGWRVVLAARDLSSVSRSADELNGENSNTALAVRMDITDPESVRTGVDFALSFGEGKLDCVINNAGIMESYSGAPWDIDPDEWWKVIETNLRGAYHMARTVVPIMVSQGGGRIIDVNSGGGANGIAEYSAYGASKAGLFRLAEAIVQYGHAAGVRVFELSPGVIPTEMTAAMPMHRERTEWTATNELLELISAIGSGELDEYTGRYLRAGSDSPEKLKRGANLLSESSRRLRVE